MNNNESEDTLNAADLDPRTTPPERISLLGTGYVRADLYDALQAALDVQGKALIDAKAKYNELHALVNNPHTDEFLQSVNLEAAHQQLRWGCTHSSGKENSDWFWLIGYLAGKAIQPSVTQDKRLHHVITTAAACLNWHAHLTGQRASEVTMRPGLGEDKQSEIDAAIERWEGGVI